jgi:hypothetical protein
MMCVLHFATRHSALVAGGLCLMGYVWQAAQSPPLQAVDTGSSSWAHMSDKLRTVPTVFGFGFGFAFVESQSVHLQTRLRPIWCFL